MSILGVTGVVTAAVAVKVATGSQAVAAGAAAGNAGGRGLEVADAAKSGEVLMRSENV